MSMFKSLGDEGLDKELLTLENDMKFLYDLAYSSFFHIFNSLDGDKHVASLTDSQAKQIINWFEKEYIPFYEALEEYEKCAKLKDAINVIKRIKKV
jgi:hypothetical protein